MNINTIRVKSEYNDSLAVKIWPHGDDKLVHLGITAYPLSVTCWIDKSEAEKIIEALRESVENLASRDAGQPRRRPV